MPHRSPYRYPRPHERILYAPEMLPASSNCQCHKDQANGLTGEFEQKIKQNPFVFMIGAVLVGLLLGRKR